MAGKGAGGQQAAAASTTDTVIKYASLAVLVIQNTSLVLFMRFAMAGEGRAKFLKVVSVFMAEVFKFVASIVLTIIEEKSLLKGLRVLHKEIVVNWKDGLKVCVPAAVYTVQNVLLYVAVENLESATYMVTYQLKILTTAFFTVTVLRRRLSIEQWLALVFLFAGVVIVQYDQKRSDAAAAEALRNATALAAENADFIGNDTLTTIPATTPLPKVHKQNSLFGFVTVLIACFLSGFAGIYFEKILKGSKVSVWIRNVQLAGPSIAFSLICALVMERKQVFANGPGIESVLAGMFQGFDWVVWSTVAIQAFGGLVVAVVIKFADNILKAFATSFSIVLNCVFAYYLFTFRPSLLFVAGAVIVMGSVFVYMLRPYKAPTHQPIPRDEEQAGAVELQDHQPRANAAA